MIWGGGRRVEDGWLVWEAVCDADMIGRGEEWRKRIGGRTGTGTWVLLLAPKCKKARPARQGS